MKTVVRFYPNFFHHLLVFFFVLGFSNDAFAQNRVNFSLQNRRVQSGVYYAELWGNVPSSTNTWSVNGTNIVITFNSAALNADSFIDMGAYDADSTLSNNALGYDLMTQTSFGPSGVSINIVKIFPPFTVKTGSFRIGTYRWSVLNFSQLDSLQFYIDNSIGTVVFHSNSTELLPNCGNSTCYGTSNPSLEYIGPAILQQSSSSSICQGSTLALSVTAAGPTGSVLNYQWQKHNGSSFQNIVGATSPSLSVSNVSTANAGAYRVLVSDANFTATSSTMNITVLTPPTITLSPQNQQICSGANVSFTVTYSGSAPISVQWQQSTNGGAGWSTLNGATSATYSLTASGTDNGKQFRALLSNSCSSVTSAVATLTVNTPPSITVHPLSQTACGGSAVNLSVTASGSNLAYQWYKNSAVIAGATSATYGIPSASTNDAGSYSVVVSGSCSPSVTSNSASLTIIIAPGISQQPVSAAKCAGESVVFSVTASGSGLTYQWLKGGSPISGASSATYSIPSVSVNDAAQYSVTVSGTAGGGCPSVITSNVVSLTVTVPPTISFQPQSVASSVGQNILFSVSATGTGLGYQWLKNGENIVGATGATYSIGAAALEDSGNYKVLVSNSCGSVASSVATLTVSQLITTIQVKVLMQGLWNGTSHVKTPVMVELRSGSALSTSALVSVQPGIVSTSGTVSVSFTSLPSGSYWLVIRNGGRLPVASASAQSITAGSTFTYDFSISLASAYPGTGVSTVASGSVFVVRSGDLDGNQTINNVDALLYYVPNNGRSAAGVIPPP